MSKQESDGWYFYVFELSNTRPALEVHKRQLSTQRLKDKLIEHILELKKKAEEHKDQYDIEYLMSLLTEMQERKLLDKEFEYGRNSDLEIILNDHLEVGDQDYRMKVKKSIYFVTRDPNFILDNLTEFLY